MGFDPEGLQQKLSRIRIRAGAGQQKMRNILMMKIIQLRKMVVRKRPEEENQLSLFQEPE
uniref:Uncharacterized protein n=1 Tax=Picea sitchensis TaxID=3332 RepID=A9NYD2_PICSI|nr:unknown [Picea sitchensis]